MPDVAFRPFDTLRVLHQYEVEFVVIGGLATVIYGADHTTRDIDITPRQTSNNLDRLSAALTAMEARIRTEGIDGGLAFDHDGSSLGRAKFWNLVTLYGDVDISFVPSGTEGFDALHAHCVVVTIEGRPTEVASLADVIRSKEAANRAKDHAVLPTLRELLARQERDAH